VYVYVCIWVEMGDARLRENCDGDIVTEYLFRKRSLFPFFKKVSDEALLKSLWAGFGKGRITPQSWDAAESSGSFGRNISELPLRTPALGEARRRALPKADVSFSWSSKGIFFVNNAFKHHFGRATYRST
jgi:hypothetical protein